VEAAGEELAEVVRAVLDTNKAGEFTLKLSVKPNGKGDNAVIVGAKISAKVPQSDLPDALFFADLDGDLLVNDPTQNRMFADVEIIDGETGEVTTKSKKGA
jgi:hypothetical protein